jgi:exopolysaccharide production protein ExoZ
LRFWQFIRRRIQRIYPPFLTVFIVYLILFQIFPEKSKLPESPRHAFGLIIANVLLLPGIFNIPALVTVAWSLSYEFFFYLTMPAIVFLTGMYHWRRDRRVALIVTGSVLFYAVCWWASVIHVRLLMFSAGALLYEAKSSTWLLNRLSRGGEIFSAALFVAGVAASGLFTPPLVNMFDSRSLNIRILPLLVSMWLLTLFCFHFPGRLQKVFSYTPLRYWGNISYSYYLCHGMVLHGLVVLYRQIPVQFQPHGSFAFWLIAPIALAVTIAGGAVLFLLVERPMSLSTAPVAVTRTAVAEDVRKAGYGA